MNKYRQKQLDQPRNKTVLERERESNYTGSLLTRATSSSQKPYEISLCNQQEITNTHQQRGDLDLSRTLTLFDKPHT